MDKKQLEKTAERKCKLNDQIHRDCYVSGFISGAEYIQKKADKVILSLKADCTKIGKKAYDLEDMNKQAKKIIDAFLDFESACMENGMTIAKDIREQAENFIKENK